PSLCRFALSRSVLQLLASVSSWPSPRDLHAFPTRRSSDLLSKSPLPRGRIKNISLNRDGGFAYVAADWEDGFLNLYEVDFTDWRSEEHTSELQSRFDLVCRLLLEKKKRTTPQARPSGGRSG